MRNPSSMPPEVVGWGCGEFFLALRSMQSFPLKYLIHTDSRRWGERVLDVEVRGPDALAEEDPARVVVFVYSQEYEAAIRERTARIGPFHVFSFRDAEFYDRRYGPLLNFFRKAAGQLPEASPPPADGAAPSLRQLGRAYDPPAIRRALDEAGIDTVDTIFDPDQLCDRAADALRQGAVLGWFQGRHGRRVLAAPTADLGQLGLWGAAVPLSATDDGDDPLLARLIGRWGGDHPLLGADFAFSGLPAVASPADAIRVFSWSGLDALIIGPCWVRKEFFRP